MGAIAREIKELLEVRKKKEKFEYISEEGNIKGVLYAVKLSENAKDYVIVDTGGFTSESEEVSKFLLYYVPKFGKYEVEEFVSNQLLYALFVTKNLTALINMEIFVQDYPRSTYISPEYMYQKLITLFTIEEQGSRVFLKFKWDEIKKKSQHLFN